MCWRKEISWLFKLKRGNSLSNFLCNCASLTMSLLIPTPKTVQQSKARCWLLLPVIPFNHPSKSKLKKDDFLTFKLWMNPNQDNSPTYDLAVPFFSQGSVEELLLFNKNIQWVCQGQINTDGLGWYALVHHLLQGDVLTAFNQAAMACGNRTLPNFCLTMQDLTSHVLPRHALQLQCRFMWHTICKTHYTSMCDSMMQLVEINQYLNEFLLFTANRAFPEEEIMNIAEFAIQTHGRRPWFYRVLTLWYIPLTNLLVLWKTWICWGI